MNDNEIETTNKYWDCECEHNYIHPKSQIVCVRCKANRNNQPDSRVNEIEIIYKNELQQRRPLDIIQDCIIDEIGEGYYYISTAEHGYLVVPIDDKNYEMAKDIREYGCIGEYAVYLEEDCEAPEFLDQIGNN